MTLSRTTSMAKSKKTSVGRISCVFFALSVWVHALEAEVNFDKLTACGDIARVYGSLKSPISATCASPRNALSRKLIDAAKVDGRQLCIEQSAPASFVEGFTCVRYATALGNGLTCFRE